MKPFILLSLAAVFVSSSLGCTFRVLDFDDAGSRRGTGSRPERDGAVDAAAAVDASWWTDTGGASGDSDASEAGDASGDAGGSEAGDECVRCVEDHCATETSRCEASAACVAVVMCLSTCDDTETACQNLCQSDGTDPGVVLLEEYLACAYGACDTACAD